MEQQLRIGVIGYGYWGPNLVRNFYALADSTVTVVSDLSEKNLQKVTSIYPTIRTTKDSQELISDPEVDAVVIATPVSTHFALAKAVLQAGKHVLIEKPMTQSSAESQELIDLAKEKGVTLMVDHTFVYTGAVKKMREFIEDGSLGDLYYFDSARINLGLLQKDTNVVWDLAPHDLSILSYLVDEAPEAVQAIGHRHVGQEQEEIAAVNIKYPSGFHAHVRVSWISPVKMRMTTLAGSKKMLVYDDVEPSEKIRVYDKGVDIKDLDQENITAWEPIYRAGDVLIPELDRAEALRTEAQHFVDCCLQNKQPRTHGGEGLSVVKMLEAAQVSLQSGGEFISL